MPARQSVVEIGRTNVDDATIQGFGRQWQHFDQSGFRWENPTWSDFIDVRKVDCNWAKSDIQLLLEMMSNICIEWLLGLPGPISWQP